MSITSICIMYGVCGDTAAAHEVGCRLGGGRGGRLWTMVVLLATHPAGTKTLMPDTLLPKNLITAFHGVGSLCVEFSL